MNKVILSLYLLFLTSSVFAQKPTLDYYFTNTNFAANIPTPKSVLGYQIGEWHVSHDQVLMYFRGRKSWTVGQYQKESYCQFKW